jgi:photosystem II stability/assembly factor-like uncharacterized protein
MKTTDGGLHWQRISPDLTGATGEIESDSSQTTVANAKQRGYGVIFTIALSSLNPLEIWAGSDTGLIHLTLDGGATWKNVTPPGLSAWSKISMVEASRFDPGVAYAAVDRHRLDDYKPYIYRTRDYGKTWKLIAEGIPASSYLRAIREDTEQRGLLYAGTEFGVYISFDDGDHWQPLQLNLPVSSVRDLQAHGDDLVIATHGRAFWILDDITPLRQIASAEKAQSSWLYRPEKTVRVDNNEFWGTPLPPEEPTAKNPPDGAVLDYVLKSSAHRLTLTITDATGKVVRHFSSEDSVPPLPKMAPIAERWFPEPQRLEVTPGMHRFLWDLSWGSSGVVDQDPDSGEEDDVPNGPRVAPGLYQVKLNVDGQIMTQPLSVVMDPRSSATSSILQEQQSAGLRIYADTLRSRQAMAEIQSVQKELQNLQLGKVQNPAISATAQQLMQSIAMVVKGDQKMAGLEEVNANLVSALGVVESGDRAIPVQAMELYQQSRDSMNQRVEQWHTLKKMQLMQLNQQLRNAKMAPIQISEIERQVVYQMTR